ncbi:MAG: Dyp-type peroxidase [Flavisolibacter sp.]
MLELDDIQHYLLTRPRATIAQYNFITFHNAETGRKWLETLLPTVGTVNAIEAGSETDMRWVTVAFTFNGLAKLGVDKASLSTFPDPFKQGMAARAEMLGDIGDNHPDNWEDNITSPDLHAVVILFARDRVEYERCIKQHQEYLDQHPGVEILSSIHLAAVPPFDYVHEHFGYRDRLTKVTIEGIDNEATPGSSPPSKPGEFFLGYPDESGLIPSMPQPEILSRNGSFLGYRKMQEHVGRFRDFLKANGKTEEEQELVAAKLMGRWRKSGAPLVLCPDKDDRELGFDDTRNNHFDYEKMDPHGYSCPLGAHIRRMNVRDQRVSKIMNRRLMIRRGGTYGPHLPDEAPEDGANRGIAVFGGCADIARQFEFLVSVWATDPEFHELNEKDPFIGNHDGTFDMTIPKRPIKKKLEGLPAFTSVRGGAYFFLPGKKALQYLVSLK